MKKKLAVELKSINKVYLLHHQKPTLSEQLLKGQFTEKFHALRDISVQIYQGERVGIIGGNGSGKTTLLKIIAGITNPNSGIVKTHGRVVSLIDLEAGFHPDLTGIENIYLNGLVIGMSRNEVKKKLSQIIAFADIDKFIDTPLYSYSQGMKLRLGFSVAIHSNPDILILDEAIGVGDEDFLEKITEEIHDLYKQKKTLIMVSHGLDFLEKNCHKIIWIENGKIKKTGTLTVINEYKKVTNFFQ